MKLYLSIAAVFGLFAIASTMEFSDDYRASYEYAQCIKHGSAQVFTDMDATVLEANCNQ